jgi:hypothetical protein
VASPPATPSHPELRKYENILFWRFGMKKLTRHQFDRARFFLTTQARPLERALFEFEFEGNPVENVLARLSEFQNPDGGFGNALEPDLRSPSSSALATEFGLRNLVELGIPSSHPMVRAAVGYSLDSIDTQTKTWRVAPLDVNDHPHAPWWHDEDNSLARTFDDYRVVPRAGLLACLYHYAGLVPADWLVEVTEATFADIQEMDVEKFGGGGDSLVYARRLAETPVLPDPVKGWLRPRVQELADRVVARNPEMWSQYCAPPLKLAPTPEAITAGVLGDCIPAHLDYLIDQQSPEGFWDVTWGWSDFPEIWEVAKEEWRGVLILEALTSLSAYGRIET